MKSSRALTIRFLQEKDCLNELTEVIHRAYQELLDQGFRYWATHQSPEETRSRAQKGQCLVALEEERLIGTITVVGPGRTGGCSYYERPGLATVHQFAIDPDFQRLGLGRLLLRHAEQLARGTGAQEIALDTAVGAARLIRFYERLGYRQVAEADWRPHVNYTSVILSRCLAPENEPEPFEEPAFMNIRASFGTDSLATVWKESQP